MSIFCVFLFFVFFFFNDTATTEIYTLSLHDALPSLPTFARRCPPAVTPQSAGRTSHAHPPRGREASPAGAPSPPRGGRATPPCAPAEQSRAGEGSGSPDPPARLPPHRRR